MLNGEFDAKVLFHPSGTVSLSDSLKNSLDAVRTAFKSGNSSILSRHFHHPTLHFNIPTSFASTSFVAHSIFINLVKLFMIAIMLRFNNHYRIFVCILFAHI